MVKHFRAADFQQSATLTRTAEDVGFTITEGTPLLATDTIITRGVHSRTSILSTLNTDLASLAGSTLSISSTGDMPVAIWNYFKGISNVNPLQEVRLGGDADAVSAYMGFIQLDQLLDPTIHEAGIGTPENGEVILFGVHPTVTIDGVASTKKFYWSYTVEA